MSKPRYDWWGYVKGMIRRYPALRDEHRALQQRSHVSTYGVKVNSTLDEESRPVEDAALKGLTGPQLREMEAVQGAISYLDRQLDGRRKKELVRMLYWDKTHTLAGCANQLYVSKRTAIRWNGEFVKQVAINFGIL